MINAPIDTRSILAQVMKSPEFTNRWAEHIIKNGWEGWVGAKMAEYIRPGKLTGGILNIFSEDERWASAFEEFKGTILERIETGIKPQSIKGFNVIIMEQKRPGPKRKAKDVIKTQDADRKGSSQAPLPEASVGEEMEQALSSIKDPSVREAARRALLKSLSRGKG